MTRKKRTFQPWPNVVELVLGSEPGADWFAKIDGDNIPRDLLELVRQAPQRPEWTNPVWAEILDLLAEHGLHDFEGTWEVDDFATRLFDLVADDLGRTHSSHVEGDPNPCIADGVFETVLAASLLNPSRQHTFEIDFHYPRYATVCQWTTPLAIVDLHLGGPNQISLKHSKTDPAVTVFSGVVNAAMPSGAALRAQRVLDEFLGALRAVGMCTFTVADIGSNTPVASVRLTDAWRCGNSPQPIPHYTQRTYGTMFIVPTEISDLERKRLEGGEGEYDRVLARHLRMLRKVLCGADPRASELRNACRIAVNADISDDPGVAILLAFGVLEGVLLSNRQDESTGRLIEAITHSLGRNFEEKKSLRKAVAHLYGVRSKFAHSGQVEGNAADRETVMSLMYRVLVREIDQLPEVNPSEASSTCT